MKRASTFEVIAARVWNVLNEGKTFYPIFSAGIFLVAHLAEWGDPAFWTRAGLALGASLLLFAALVRYDFPLHLRWWLGPPLLVALALAGPDWRLFAWVLGVYLFFTVIFWGTIYYRLRIRTPWTNFTRFWKLVLKNRDSTSGNFWEQVPKALLTTHALEWCSSRIAAGETGALAGYVLLTVLLGVYAWFVHLIGFDWRPAEYPYYARERYGSGPVPARARRVVMVVIDGCRKDRLEQARTPFLDSLRRSGTEFTRMETIYPARTVCCFASFFTGTYPREHGITSNFVWRLGVRCESVFDALEKAGKKGRLLGIAHLIDAFGSHVDAITAVMDNRTADRHIIDMAKEIMESKQPDFFAVQLIGVDQTGHSRGPLYPEYVQKIEEADALIREFYEWLQAKGYLEDATFIVCADHGQSDGIGGHGHLGEGERFVPFFMSGVGIPAGRRVDEPKSIVSVAATVCRLLGAPIPEKARGPLLAGGELDGGENRTRRLVVVIPAYNEEASIARVIRAVPRERLRAEGIETKVLVVDDGSSDGTRTEAERAGADEVLVHPANRGLGAAVRSGLEAALAQGADVAVIIDADNEYPPDAIPDLIRPILADEADYVLGSRFRGRIRGMKPIRRIGNYCFTLLQSLILGRWISDGQTGLRAFSRDVLRDFRIVHDYNYAQVLTLNILRQGYRLREIPIDYSVRTTGTSFIKFRAYLRHVLPAIVRELRLPPARGGGRS